MSIPDFYENLNLKIMRTIRIMTALTIVILSTILCLAQFSPKRTATGYKKCQQTAVAVPVSITEAEDFSLISLLTLKFM
jgi:hypothetical protein